MHMSLVCSAVQIGPTQPKVGIGQRALLIKVRLRSWIHVAGSAQHRQHPAKRPCPHQLQGMPRPVSCGFVANRPVGSRIKRQKQRSLGACAVLLCPHRIGNIQARDNELRDSDASACGTWTCQPCKAAGLSLETVTCRPLMATCCGTV